MYPFSYVRPDGTVAVTGATEVEEPLMIYNPTTETWTTSDPNAVDGGSSAMYDTGKVIKAGSTYGSNAWVIPPRRQLPPTSPISARRRRRGRRPGPWPTHAATST